MEAQKPNTPQKPVAAKSAKTQGEHKVRGIKNAFLVIVCCAVVAVCLFLFLFGNPSHFDTTLTGPSVAFLDNPEGHWKPTDLIGTVFMGGRACSSDIVLDSNRSLCRARYRFEQRERYWQHL